MTFVSLVESLKLLIFCHFQRRQSTLVSLAELEQLRHGLAILGFDSLMAAYPQLLREAFEPKQKITSDYIQNLFVPNFSSEKSNRRMQEEAIMD